MTPTSLRLCSADKEGIGTLGDVTKVRASTKEISLHRHNCNGPRLSRKLIRSLQITHSAKTTRT